MLSYIHIFRGIAAFLVVLHHAAGISEKYFQDISIERFFLFGDAGVTFFFVLSGFIIFFVHKNWIDRPKMLKNYFWRRFIRVYPVYWVVFFITLPLYYSLFKSLPSTFEIFKSFLLIEHEMIVYVAWTLVHEVTFYFIFSILIFNRTIGIAIMVLWTVSIFMLSPRAVFFDTWFDVHANHLISNYNLLFFIGMLAANFTTSIKHQYTLHIGVIGLILFFICRVFELNYEMDGQLNIFYGFSSFLIIFGFASWEFSTKSTAKSKTLILLGSASYSIYLVHSQVISGVTKFLVMTGATENLHVTIGFLLSTTISILIGLMFYKWIETPLLNYLYRLKPV